MAVQCPEFVVECDLCCECVTMEGTEYAGDPPTWGVDASTLEEYGWTKEGDETYCKECSGERKVEE